MTDIAFTPAFKHIPWVDNRDRVAAGGPNGFNIRFDTLQKDLENLSGVVKKVDEAIKASGQPPAVQRMLSVAPAFVPVAPSRGWELDSFGVAVRPATDVNVKGMVIVSPPDGARLKQFRAIGTNNGSGTLRITLFRAPLTSASSSELLARITGTGSYDDTQAVQAGKEQIDMSAFRYFVVAQVSEAAVSDTVTVTSIQLSYTLT